LPGHPLEQLVKALICNKKLIFLIGLGPIIIEFPYISVNLTDKSDLEKPFFGSNRAFVSEIIMNFIFFPKST
jgi:hypothetical protein